MKWPSRDVETAADSRSADRGGRLSRSRCRGSNGGGGGAAAGALMEEAEPGVVAGARKSIECDAMGLGIQRVD